MTDKELYAVYAKWSGQLHYYVVKELREHVDCEFFPDTWKFAIYSGHAEDADLGGFGALPATVPGLWRPPGERKEIIQLPRPEDDPSSADLDKAFVELCLAAARVLQIDLAKPKLQDKGTFKITPMMNWLGDELKPPEDPKKHALPKIPKRKKR